MSGEGGFISSLEAAGGAPKIRHKLKTFPLLHSSRCCQPLSEEQHAGEDFGYVVAFRPLGSATWIQAAVASPDASRYVYRNHSVAPLTLFEVKVGVYNSRGEGPFSRAVRVFSAEEGEQETLTGRESPALTMMLVWTLMLRIVALQLNTADSSKLYTTSTFDW